MTFSLLSPDEPFTINADWVSPWSGRTWADFRSKCQAINNPSTHSEASVEEPSLAVCGPIRFESAHQKMMCFLAGQRNNDESLMWQLRIEQQPSEPAPPEVEDAEQRVGGLFGFLSLLNNTRAEIAPLANFEVNVLLQEGFWTCRMLPRPVDLNSPESDALVLGSEVVVEQIGLRFISGAGGIEETTIIYFHQPRSFSVQIRARSLLKFAESSLIPTAADEAFAVVQGQFFQRRKTI